MSAPDPSTTSQQIQLKYENFTARYANHALVTVGAEEAYLDFTSGIMNERPGVSVMPIHTRIAMTHAGLVRLSQLLTQTLQNASTAQPAASAPAANVDPLPPSFTAP